MNVGTFDYLLAPQQRSAISSDRLEILAKTAAKRYVDEGLSLNDTIGKLAADNNLNANQVERVCEVANIATHQALWPKTAAKEKVAFQVADPRVVLRVTRISPTLSSAPSGGVSGVSGGACGCSSMADYAGPPKLPAPGPSMATLMGADAEQCHNGLYDEPERKKIVVIIEKKAAELRRIKDQAIVATLAAETAEKLAYAAIKQEVLGGTSFGQIYEAAACSGLSKVAGQLLPKFRDRLLSESSGSMRVRLEKLAILKAPESLISNDLGNVTVVNGSHPVLVSLDTVQRTNGVVKNTLSNLVRANDELKVYTQRLQELS